MIALLLHLYQLSAHHQPPGVLTEPQSIILDAGDGPTIVTELPTHASKQHNYETSNTASGGSIDDCRCYEQLSTSIVWDKQRAVLVELNLCFSLFVLKQCVI